MKSIIKTSKRGIIVILTLCILSGIIGTCVNVAAMAAETTATVEETTVTTEDTTVVTEENTQELVPMMARGCNSVPQRAYSMYAYITGGNDPSIYTYHEYGNKSYPFLPRNTTYVTYYMTGSARLVIGANGSAYYTPDHYSSWIKMY